MSSWQPDDVLLTDSEDDDNELLEMDYRGRFAMLFVIDAHLYEDPELFRESMQILRKAFVSGVLTNKSDLLGVVFANTQLSPEPFEMDGLERIWVAANCAIYLPLRQLTLDIVRHLCRFVDGPPENVGRLYGIADGRCSWRCSFAALIGMCINLFEYCGYALNTSDIVYLTARDSPHEPESHEYRMAFEKAVDLEGKGIDFHVVPMVNSFDYAVFYKEFLTLVRNGDKDSFVVPDPQQERAILVDRKLCLNYRKRCLGHFKLSLGAGLDMSVQYYNYFQLKYFPQKVKLMRKDKAIVQRKRVIVVRDQDAETMEFTQERELKVTEGWYETCLGAKKINVTQAQMDRVRNLHSPGMMLLGFKPKCTLPENVYYMPAQFMYPDNQAIVGSKRLFAALWQRCLEREKIAICLFMRKRKSKPRYVALVPVTCDSAKDPSRDCRTLLTGDGFKIVYLPFAKHIRHNILDDWYDVENSAPDDGVDVFEKVVKSLRIKYQADHMHDPKLEQLQEKLLAQALDDVHLGDGTTDLPDPSAQDERIADLLPQIEQIFGVDIEPAKKRPAPRDDTTGNAAKIPKMTDEQLKCYDTVQQLALNNQLSGCTVPQLRFILEEHFEVKMPKSCKKEEHIGRITALCVNAAAST